MNTLTASSAPQADLPAPTVDGTRDGGLGYDDLKDRNAFTYVVVGPLPIAQPGDGVTVFWAGASVKEHTVTQKDLDSGTFAIAVVNGKIVDAGDGNKAVTYTATYLPGGGVENSLPLTVTVKRSVPGGLDPYPDTPVNENLTAATVSPSPVPIDATAVVISVPLWLNPADGDVLGVSWNGTPFEASPLVAPFPDPVILTLTAQQILEAGVGAAVPVTWSVHDVVSNWPGWAPYTTVDVQLEDPGLITAPRIGDLAHGWTQIDLVTLGTADLPVFTPDYEAALAGDTVIVHGTGTTLGGNAVAYDTPPQSVDGSGFGLVFTLPNATVRSLAGETLRVWYTAGAEAKPSHSVRVPVVGAAQVLPVPVVTEAVDTDGDGTADQLDPDSANPAHITIDYPTMALYDTVTLILEGTDGTGAPVRYEANRQVSTVTPLILSVAQTEILTFVDGQMDVYYLVEPFSQRGRAFVRALQAQASAHLPLSVRRGSAEQPLPAPTVIANGSAIENGGFLDPAAEECTALASYPNIVKGDEITYSWVGIVSTRTQTYKVADSLKPPADYVNRDFIVTNTGGKVVVSYSVRRGGVGPVVSSATMEFRIDTATPFTIDSTPVDLTGAQSYTRHATGGVPPYTYVSSNAAVVKVPDAGTGIIQGVTKGSATITVTDSQASSGSYPVTVAAALSISGPGSVNENETFKCTASGGVRPYRFTSSDPSVAKVTDNNGNGVGVSAGGCTITVTDQAGNTALHQLTVQVVPKLTVSPPGYANARPGQNFTFTAHGGTPPYTWKAGTYPDRLHLHNTSGQILSVTTTASFQIAAEVYAQDSAGQSAPGIVVA